MNVLSDSVRRALGDFSKKVTRIHQKNERRRGRGNNGTNKGRKKKLLPAVTKSDEDVGRTTGETPTIPESTASKEEGLH